MSLREKFRCGRLGGKSELSLDGSFYFFLSRIDLDLSGVMLNLWAYEARRGGRIPLKEIISEIKFYHPLRL